MPDRFTRPDVVPDSRQSHIHTPRNAVPSILGYWVPIYCASCGVEGGKVPADNCTFAFWLCQPCFATYGELTSMMVMPDEVFYERLRQAQLETYGRPLTADEVAAALRNPDSLESQLARDRAALTPAAG